MVKPPILTAFARRGSNHGWLCAMSPWQRCSRCSRARWCPSSPPHPARGHHHLHSVELFIRLLGDQQLVYIRHTAFSLLLLGTIKFVQSSCVRSQVPQLLLKLRSDLCKTHTDTHIAQVTNSEHHYSYFGTVLNNNNKVYLDKGCL